MNELINTCPFLDTQEAGECGQSIIPVTCIRGKSGIRAKIGGLAVPFSCTWIYLLLAKFGAELELQWPKCRFWLPVG